MSNNKPLRKIEDLTLKECNRIFARLSEITGVPNVQNAVILPPLTEEQYTQLLQEVFQQLDQMLGNGTVSNG